MGARASSFADGGVGADDGDGCPGRTSPVGGTLDTGTWDGRGVQRETKPCDKEDQRWPRGGNPPSTGIGLEVLAEQLLAGAECGAVVGAECAGAMTWADSGSGSRDSSVPTVRTRIRHARDLPWAGMEYEELTKTPSLIGIECRRKIPCRCERKERERGVLRIA